MKRPVIVIAILVVGLLLRLFLAYFFYGNYDQTSYRFVSEIMQRGGNVYAETYRYNYSPVWSFVLLGLKTITDFTHLPLHFVIRTFLTLVDLLCAVFIGLIAQRRSAMLAYWINPVAILIVGYHGQFDNFAALFLLIGIYLLKKKTSPSLVWLAGTASIMVKHITIFGVFVLFLYAFRKKWQAALATAATILVFLLSFLPYLPAGMNGILKNVFRYSGLHGLYGFSDLLPLWGTPVFVAIMLVIAIFVRQKFQLVQGMEFAFVSFLTFTSGIAQQYFILPLLFGSFRLSYPLIIYSAASFVFLLFSGNSIHILELPLWNLVWFAAAGWFLSFFIQPRAIIPAHGITENQT